MTRLLLLLVIPAALLHAYMLANKSSLRSKILVQGLT